MSTEKNKFSKKDKLYMNLALKLARARYGLTGVNPSVGRESTTEVSPFLQIEQIIYLNFYKLEMKSINL